MINYILNNNMEEILKLLKLFEVILVTTSNTEKSFSTLKRINMCSNSIMFEHIYNALTCEV